MAALHEALKTLGPCDFNEFPLDDLRSVFSEAFGKGQLIVDSVPISASGTTSSERPRSNTTSSVASNASEILLSSARSASPPADVEVLQKEWKTFKLNAKENPLGMSVYKLGAKDGRGAWFARRSVHEGLGFSKWKRALEREFPETMKVQGGPGEGNVRGIGGETRVAYKNLEGVGKMEVFLLSAQFPGPTTPRDFVTMFLTSDQALSKSEEDEEVPRHFMVISRPCIHPATAPRDGFIRGQYESVEFIREIPIKKAPRKSFSAANLGQSKTHARTRSSTLGEEAAQKNSQDGMQPGTENLSIKDSGAVSDAGLPSSEGRARGKTISFDTSRGADAKGENFDVPRDSDESEQNPIEWIMITRSDPGGSVPRFMVERGTPGGIVADASKFLDWACSKDIEDLESDAEAANDDDQEINSVKKPQSHDSGLHNYQTNGHLAGLESEPSENRDSSDPATNGTLYGRASGAVAGVGGYIAAHTPAIIVNHLPSQPTEDELERVNKARRDSVSSITTTSSVGSFASALETRQTSGTNADDSHVLQTQQEISGQDKELQKLEEKKRKIDERLKQTREKEMSKKNEGSAKEEEASRKAAERHEREVKKQEEKFQKEVEKLRQKKLKEETKAEERRRKVEEKDEKTRLLRELEEVKAEVSVLRKEKEILRGQVGDLQAENTMLAVRVGKLGSSGEDILRSVREEVGKGGRLRASSLKSMERPLSLKRSATASLASGDSAKDTENNALKGDA